MKARLAALPVIGTALRVQERYRTDAADPLAAAIAFFGFLSLFPLLLLAVSVAGFVLDDPADQVAVAERITAAIPGFDQTVDGGDNQVEALLAGVVAQRGTVGVIGLLTLLFSGLRVVNAAMTATRVVFRGAVLTGVGARVRQVTALAGLGALTLASTAASSVAGTGLGQLPASVALLLSVGATFALDVGVFLGAYTLLAPTTALSVRDRVPGALLAATGWTVLKVAGASWVAGQVDSANALYGALGGVIALMLLFYLAGRLYLYGAQLSAIRYEDRHGPLVAPHDQQVLQAAGQAPEVDAHPTAEPAADQDGPPPPPRTARLARPVDPGPAGSAATISTATRARLDAGAGAPGPLASAGSLAAPSEPGRDVRTALAFALAAAALAAGWRVLGGRSE